MNKKMPYSFLTKYARSFKYPSPEWLEDIKAEMGSEQFLLMLEEDGGRGLGRTTLKILRMLEWLLDIPDGHAFWLGSYVVGERSFVRRCIRKHAPEYDVPEIIERIHSYPYGVHSLYSLERGLRGTSPRRLFIDHYIPPQFKNMEAYMDKLNYIARNWGMGDRMERKNRA